MITTPARAIVQGGGQRVALIVFLGWLGTWFFPGQGLGTPPDSRSLPTPPPLSDIPLPYATVGLLSKHQNISGIPPKVA